ncbi:MAG: hypothetical protein ACFFDT_04125 [Candidatus Hodarchaeota archaeon]
MTQVHDRGWNRIKAELAKLKNAVTAVGFFSGDVYPSSGIGIAGVAAVHEFGTKIRVTPKMRGYLAYRGLHLSPSTTHITIPERSFMRAWLDTNKQKIKDFKGILLDKLYNGTANAETILAMLGDWAGDEIKKFIVELKEPPNAPFTIEQKGSSNPLIDKGTMVNAVKHREFWGGMRPKG